MPQPERRRLAEVVGESLEHAVRPEAPGRLDLELGGTARPDEVRVVRVGQAVRLRARVGHDRALFEREHRFGRTGEREQRLDRVPALGVGRSVARALHHAERDVELSGDLLDERRGRQRCASELEMRGSAQREGSATEERTPDVRALAAGACDEPSRRTLEWRVPAVDDAGRDEDVQRARLAFQVELEACRAVERAPRVRPDLGADALLAKQREGAAGGGAAPEVEVEAPLPVPAQVEIAGGVEERRELREPVAAARRRNAREFLADVLGRDQSDTPSSASSRRLMSTPADP